MSKDKNKYGGGAQTNINGLSFEEEMDICSFLIKIGYDLDDEGNVYLKDKKIGIVAKKNNFYKNILKKSENFVREKIISKILLPDAAFLNLLNNTLYIIEIKCQDSDGSVDEKLQTCDFKKEQYIKLSKYIENVKSVKMIYILSFYYLQTKYDDVFDYMDRKKCLHEFFYTRELLGL